MSSKGHQAWPRRIASPGRTGLTSIATKVPGNRNVPVLVRHSGNGLDDCIFPA